MHACMYEPYLGCGVLGTLAGCGHRESGQVAQAQLEGHARIRAGIRDVEM